MNGETREARGHAGIPHPLLKLEFVMSATRNQTKFWCDCVKSLTGTDFVELFTSFTMSGGSGSQAGREQRRARAGSRPEKSTLFIVSAGL